MVEIIGIADTGKSCRPGCRHQGTLVELVGRTEQNRMAVGIEEYQCIGLVEADHIEVLHIRHHTMVQHSFIMVGQAAVAAIEEVHSLHLAKSLEENGWIPAS